MGLFASLLLGNGRLKPELRGALESEGIVAIAENLPGTIRYRNFRSPGRRFHRKIQAERIAIGISELRVVVYCRSGRVRLIDTPFSEQRLAAVEVSLLGADTVSLRVDFDRAGVDRVSGQMEIRAKSQNAPNIVGQLQARMPR